MGNRKKDAWPPALLAALVLALIAHLVVSIDYNLVHHFIPDEIVYMLMNKALSMGSLAIQNGYEEFQNNTLIFTMTSAYKGQTFAQYPAIYTFLSLPFYLLFEKNGLVLLNQFAFFTILFAVYRTQQALFGQRHSALFALITLVGGSYLWLYSQAIIPHLTQLALIMLALWLFAEAFWQHKALWRYLIAGLLLGAALGVRYDTLFVLPAVLLPPLFAYPIRVKALLALAPGLLFGLLALSITNEIKFGSFTPFTYNADSGYIRTNPVYYQLALLGGGVLLVVWVGSRWVARHGMPGIKWLIPAGGLALTAGFVLFADWILSFLYGFNLTVIDFSDHPVSSQPRASVTRTEYGGFMYMDEYKRALLQSCPFIAIIAVLALRKLRLSKQEWYKYLWLLVATLPFFAFYGLLAWDGGFAYHMRYYIPTLPLLAMLCGQIVWRLVQAYGLDQKPTGWLWPIGGGLGAAVATVLLADEAVLFWREWWLLSFPLWLWAVVLLAVTIGFYDHAARWLKQAILSIVWFTVFWGGASSILIVYPHLNEYKQRLFNLSLYYEEVIAQDAVVMSTAKYFSHFFGQHDRRFRMATIYEDSDPVTPNQVRAMIKYFDSKGIAFYLTHDLKSFPILKDFFPKWGFRLKLEKEADEALGAPAISRVVPRPVDMERP